MLRVNRMASMAVAEIDIPDEQKRRFRVDQVMTNSAEEVVRYANSQGVPALGSSRRENDKLICSRIEASCDSEGWGVWTITCTYSVAVDMDRAAFMAAILEAPDDDLPRLIMADWLQERGESDRAEFIRVQCELARWESGNANQQFAHRDRAAMLRGRERELYLKADWFGIGDNEWIRLYDGCSTRHGADGFNVLWARGFAQKVYSTSAVWLARGQSVLSAQPIESVELVDVREDWKPCVLTIKSDSGFWFLGIDRGQLFSSNRFATRAELIEAMPAQLRQWGIGYSVHVTGISGAEIHEGEAVYLAPDSRRYFPSR